jgi:hypothetical protein
MEGPRTTLIRDNLTNMNAVNLSAGLASQVKKLKSCRLIDECELWNAKSAHFQPD